MREGGPTFARLAQDVGGTGLALRIQAVERLLQAFVGRLTRIDGAANLVHAAAFRFKPKNAGPDQRVPVIARATSLKERHVRLSQVIT